MITIIKIKNQIEDKLFFLTFDELEGCLFNCSLLSHLINLKCKNYNHSVIIISDDKSLIVKRKDVIFKFK